MANHIALTDLRKKLRKPDLARAKLIVADCPWKFGDALPGKTRGAVRNYRVMGVEELCRFPLPPMAPDALLLFWRVSSMVEEAYSVVRAWGFVPKSELVWSKIGDSGLAFGMGRILRGAHETCIVATRGKFKPATLSERTVFFAPLGRHSAKPEEFFEIAERLVPLGRLGEHVELFSRIPRKGWLHFGDAL